MISQISGFVVAVSERSIVVDVSGVGYELFVPKRSQFLPDTKVVVFTRLIVREDDMSLYGFASTQERSLFDALIVVNGVGPKLALTVLSDLGFTATVAAISNDDERALTAVSGVGAKTAKMMLLGLAGKFESNTLYSPNSDLLEALVGLGWSAKDAAVALQQAGAESSNQQIQLKLALRYLDSAKKVR